MQESNLQGQIEGARAYEALHVPALFSQWCPVVLDAAGVGVGHRVLDVACGTGVLAREAAARVGDSGHVAGLDPEKGMLAVAEELAPGVDWRQGTAESLPFPESSFDAVCCQFGLMFFPDQTRAMREMLRVLRPGGRFAVAVWNSLDSIEAYRIEVELIQRLAGDAAADAVRAPFALGDEKALAALIEAAGAQAAAVSTHGGTARFPSVRVMVEADLRGWLPIMGVVLSEETVQTLLAEADRCLARYQIAQGPATFGLSAHVVSGVAGSG